MGIILRLFFAFVLSSSATQGASMSSASAVIAAPAKLVQYFPTEAAAQAHCPKDVVVWLNTKTGVYHLKGERWYGATKRGAYVCKSEADATPGDRETRNGQ